LIVLENKTNEYTCVFRGWRLKHNSKTAGEFESGRFRTTYAKVYPYQRNTECPEEKREPCSNFLYYACNSFSPILGNVKNNIESANVSSEAFINFINNRAKHCLVCADCLRKSPCKREYAAKLPKNYKHHSSFKKVSLNVLHYA